MDCGKGKQVQHIPNSKCLDHRFWKGLQSVFSEPSGETGTHGPKKSACIIAKFITSECELALFMTTEVHVSKQDENLEYSLYQDPPKVYMYMYIYTHISAFFFLVILSI